MAIDIEPTDSTFFQKLALIDHLQGKFFHEIGLVPSHISLVVLDPGGKVDSVAFNNRSWSEVLRPLAAEHRLAYEMLQEGIVKEDLTLIGEASSLSAEIFQNILYNPLLEFCKAVLKSSQALGFCRAHSGTIIGILYDNRKMLAEEIHAHLHEVKHKLVNIIDLNVVNGGARLSFSENGEII